MRADVAALLVSVAGCAPISTEPVQSEEDPKLSDPALPRTEPVAPLEPTPHMEPYGLDAGESSDAGQPEIEPTDVDAASAPVPIPRPDATGFCAALPQLEAPPTIDGTIEPGLTLEDVSPQGWTEGIPDGNSMRFAAAWLSSGIYFFLDVTDTELNPAAVDAPIWQGDSVETYVDHDGVLPASGYDAAGTKQFMLGAPLEAQTDPVRADVYMNGNRQSSWDAPRYVAVPSAGGYTVELLVEAADLELTDWSLEAGDYVGFDLAHSVSHPIGITGTEGNRLGQYFLRVADPPTNSILDYPWTSSNVFCVARLD